MSRRGSSYLDMRTRQDGLSHTGDSADDERRLRVRDS
jgi:hypothetical protein